MNTADQRLLNQWILKRDAQAFKALTSKYSGMVHGTCLRVLRNAADAEDVTQECFVALASTSSGPQSPMGAWLHAVATHKALNLRRSDRRRQAREERFAKSESATSEIEWDDVSRFIDEAIEALPIKLRVAIIGHFMDDQSVTAIAAQENVTPSAISQRIQKGVSLIRAQLKKRGIAVTASALATLFAENAFASPIAMTGLSQTLGKIALSGSTAAAPHVTTSASLGMKGVAAVSVAAIALIGAWIVATRSESQPASAAEFSEAHQPKSEAAQVDESLVVASPDPVAEVPTVETVTESPESVVVAAAVSESSPLATTLDNWRDVVKAYTSHQDRIRSITIAYKDTMKGEYLHRSYSDQPEYREANQWGTITTDGERCYMEQRRWGHWFGGEIIAEDRADLHACVWNGSDVFEYHGGGGVYHGVPGSLQLWLNARDSMIRDSAFSEQRSYLLYSRYPGGPMLGYPVPTGRRLEEFLYSTHSIALRFELELVGGSECYVVDAETDYGTFVVWFNPTRGFNVAKFILSKGPGHLVLDRVLSEGMTHDYIYDVQRFEKVDGLWVPKESTYRQRVSGLGGEGFDYTSSHKRTSITLNAGANDDASYALHAEHIPNGSRWMNTDNLKDQMEYVWYNGEVVLKTDRTSYRPTPAQVKARALVAGGFGAGSTSGE